MSHNFVQTAVICGVCGKIRGDVNHWFAFENLNDGVLLIEAWSDDTIAYIPACGESCLLKLVSRSLDSL